jgi:hypothetical protein
MIDFGKRDIENGHYQRAQYHEKRSDPLIAMDHRQSIVATSGASSCPLLGLVANLNFEFVDTGARPWLRLRRPKPCPGMRADLPAQRQIPHRDRVVVTSGN